MTPVPPVRSANRATASTFGPIEPAANCCSAAITRSAVASTSPTGVRLGRAPVGDDVLDVGGDDEDVGLERARRAAPR